MREWQALVKPLIRINDLSFNHHQLRKTLGCASEICRSSIINSMKPLMRINGLSFNHHQIVAPCEPPEQRDWLQKAKAGTGKFRAFREWPGEDFFRFPVAEIGCIWYLECAMKNAQNIAGTKIYMPQSTAGKSLRTRGLGCVPQWLSAVLLLFSSYGVIAWIR